MKADGRQLIGGGGLAVDRFRRRLLGRLDLEPGRGRRALDLGCGDGLEAEFLAARGFQVDAYDLEPHPRWAAIANQWKDRIRFRTADAARLGGLKRRYDLVFQKDMLHHVAAPAAVLGHMRLLLKPGGRLYVLECNRLNPVSYVHLTLLGGHQHFTPWRLRHLLNQAGLAGAGWQKVEARVWPLESGWFQDAVDRVQDLVEALPGLRHLAVYHLIRWDKPGAGRKKGKP